MFSNFIYFITAILLFGAYGQVSPSVERPDAGILAPAFTLAVFFFVLEYFFFRQLGKTGSENDFVKKDLIFTRASGLFSIAVLLIYASFIYILDLSQFLPDLINSSKTESLKGLAMLIIFTSLIVTHWAVSYPTYKKIYEDRDGLLKYIKSQLMFAIPVIFPWLFILILSDILSALPFQGLNEWLATTTGEICLLIFLVAGMSFMAPFLIKLAWGCKPLAQNYSLEIINEICRKTGVKFSMILEWPLKGGNAITAGVMGLFSRFRYLLITPALIRSMSEDELGAVIAHEAGHVKYKHMLLYMAVIGSFSFTTIIAAPSFEEVLVFSGFFTNFLGHLGLSGRTLSFIPGLFSVIFFIIFIRFVFGYFMRNFERQADSYSMEIMGSPFPLVSAFQKIVWLTRQDPEKPSWHHYSIKERIDFILRCETDDKAAKRHDKRVFISLGAFFSCLILIISTAYLYDNSRIRDDLFRRFLTNASKGELNSFEMDRIMADAYYLKGQLEKSLSFYEKADSEKPDDPEVLNSLAWIYATSEKKELRNPEKAIIFAKRAVLLKPDSAHILDTYAESLYAASDYSNAVIYAEKALSLAEEKDKNYYQKQIDKFRKKLVLMPDD